MPKAIWFSQQEIPRLNPVFNPSLSQLPTDFIPFPPGKEFNHPPNRRLRGLHDENLPIAFNKVLQACSRARRWEHALSVLRRMCQSEALEIVVMRSLEDVIQGLHPRKTDIAPEIRLEWKMSFLFVVFVSINSILVQERNPNLHSHNFHTHKFDVNPNSIFSSFFSSKKSPAHFVPSFDLKNSL